MDENEIERKDFTISLRGYDREEVDAYLAELAQEIRSLRADRGEPLPPSQPQSASAAYQQIGEETSRILLVADEAGREIKARAEREAASVVAEARTKAEEMTRRQQEELRSADEHIRRLREARDTLATQLEDVGRRLQETVARVKTPVEDVIGTVERPAAAAAPAPTRERPAAPAPARERPTTRVPPMERARPEPAAPPRPETKAPPVRREEPRQAPPRPVKEAPQRKPPDRPTDTAQRQQEPSSREARPERPARRESPGPSGAVAVEPRPEVKPRPEPTPPEVKPRPERAKPEAAVEAAKPEAKAPAAPPAEETRTDAVTASATAALEQLLEEVRRDREEGQREVQAALGEITKEAPAPQVRSTAPAPTIDAEEVLRGRDDAVGDGTATAARRLKRLLQEDQNYLLDRLRTHRGKGSFDETISPSDVELERFQVGMSEVLEQSFLAGRRTAGLTDTSDAARPVADLISKQIVTPLRRDLGRIIDSGLAAGDTVKSIAERASDVFRVWKGIRSELLGEGLVYAAYHQGLVDAWRRGNIAQKRWIRSPTEEDCPRGVCDKNAEAGSVELGATFPSGHLAPPAHGGCTCVLTEG